MADVVKLKKVDTNETISYENAVLESKEIIGTTEKNLWRLAEIAYRLEPKYGDQTLARYAGEVRLDIKTVRYYRQIYARFKDLDTKGGLPAIWTLKVLLNAPNAEEIIEEHPDLTRAEAKTYVQEQLERKKKATELRELFLHNMHTSREWFLVDCGGGHYDCSIFKGNLSTQEFDELITEGESFLKIVTKTVEHWKSVRESQK